MLILTHLAGFGANTDASRGAEADITAGTNIGDMTETGGLAAAFDGTTSQVYASCATKTAAPGYVGKTFSGPRQIHSVDIYGSSNTGLDGNTGSTTYTVQLYGKAGSAPSTSTDGTLLASQSAADSNGISIIGMVSSDDTTFYDHAWVRISTTGVNAACAELVIYGWS